MVLRFSPPIAFSDACSTARASCADTGADSPTARTNITNLFTISPPESASARSRRCATRQASAGRADRVRGPRRRTGRRAVCQGPIIPATRNHEGALSRAHTEFTKKTQEIRDDDDEVGVPRIRVGAGWMLNRAGSGIHWGVQGRGGSPFGWRRECQARWLQRYAGTAGTPADREVRPRQRQLALRGTDAKRSQRSAGV